jgi:hypothetical protein
MIPSYLGRQRPGILTFLGIVSLIWSTMTLVGTVVGVVLCLLVGAGSWFGGTVVGTIGTIVATLVLLWLVACSILSILLFKAGLDTLRDDPAGIHLHRLWAFISLALDLVGLMATGGMAANSWTGLIYAGAVLYLTNLPEVRAYYGVAPRAAPGKPPVWVDDMA